MRRIRDQYQYNFKRRGGDGRTYGLVVDSQYLLFYSAFEWRSGGCSRYDAHHHNYRKYSDDRAASDYLEHLGDDQSFSRWKWGDGNLERRSKCDDNGECFR